METFRKKISYGLVLLLVLISNFSVEAKTAAELAQQDSKMSLYGEIAIGVLFVVAVTLFIIWKSKHDRKERERSLEQMKKVAAHKRRAA